MELVIYPTDVAGALLPVAPQQNVQNNWTVGTCVHMHLSTFHLSVFAFGTGT